jgi:hypothetical protein
MPGFVPYTPPAPFHGGITQQWLTPPPVVWNTPPVVTVPPGNITTRHHHMHGLGDLGYMGIFDPLGIGIDMSSPLFLGAAGLAIWYFFLRKKGR